MKLLTKSGQRYNRDNSADFKSGNNLRLKQRQINLQHPTYFLNVTCNISRKARIVFILYKVPHLHCTCAWLWLRWMGAGTLMFLSRKADLQWHAYVIYAIGSCYLTCNTAIKARTVFILCKIPFTHCTCAWLRCMGVGSLMLLSRRRILTSMPMISIP